MKAGADRCGRHLRGLWRAGLPVLLSIGCLAPAHAETDDEPGYETLAIPFPFYNESFGIAGGFVYGRAGWPESQARVLGTVLAGTEGSVAVLLAGQDLRTPWLERLFIDPFASVGYFGEIDAYINGNPAFVGQNAGTNDSSENDFVSGQGFDNFARIRFHYLLPIGSGGEQVVPNYKLVDGLAVGGFTGARSLNPLESGRSFIDVRPFYRSQEIDGDDLATTINTNGLDLGLTWDNRDFPNNPARGQSVALAYSRDFGLFNSSGAWSVWQAEVDQYFELGDMPRIRQSVLALNAWTASSPTFERQANGTITSGPPAYAGATLGGLWRMRAFPAQRFNDRAAIYYAAELRVIPEWNPFEAWPAFQDYADVEWLQLVPFLEVGRVAPDWDFDELHSDMKVSAGFGIRAWASGFVVRADTAVSDEGAAIKIMISQPFRFL